MGSGCAVAGCQPQAHVRNRRSALDQPSVIGESSGMTQIRLLTFGGLALFVGDVTATGPATRRHRLALLTLLAVARERGLNRDKIQGYLWPESDAERARHGLNQLVYFQR